MRLIDADKIKEKSYYAYPSIDHICYSRSVVDVTEIDVAETEDAELVRHGHWINAGHDEWSHYRKCSVCGKTFVNISKTKYCSDCGAKMDEVEK